MTDEIIIFRGETKLASLKIEKFIDNTPEATFHVPFYILRAATKLLPHSASAALAAKGFNLDEILETQKRGKTYRKTVSVREHKINKTIVLSF